MYLVVPGKQAILRGGKTNKEPEREVVSISKSNQVPCARNQLSRRGGESWGEGELW